MPLPTPHLEKLNAAIRNEKLPHGEISRLRQALQRYAQWISQMSAVDDDRETAIERMVNSLNDYKLYIDLELIFDSDQDFLYRQKGQLKLDNTIIEEFLPHLIKKAIPELDESLELGPRSCFSAVYFTSSLSHLRKGAGLQIRKKDQDFAISRRLYLMASHDKDFRNALTKDTYVGYVTAECKTNLDKTMFQEAAATAHDVKTAVPGAKYFLLCDWLDMTPTSTATTDIDEVLILRKAKRLSSNVRRRFSTAAGRKASRADFKAYLEKSPYEPEVFKRLIDHIVEILDDQDPKEDDVLRKGYF